MDKLAGNITMKMQLLSKEDNKAVANDSFVALGDVYKQPEVIGPNIPNIVGIVSKKRKIYYEATDESKTPRYFELELGLGKQSHLFKSVFDNPTFNDSVTLSFPEPTHLVFCLKTIETPSLHTKFRVAHHLGTKIFFIAFLKDSNFGALFAANLETPEKMIVAQSVCNSAIFKDVLVDQYTGDIIFAHVDNKICVFRRLSYFNEVNELADTEQL